MDQVLDFVFGIRWWQWMLGMGCIAGLYYFVAGILFPYAKGAQAELVQETEKEKQADEERGKLDARQQREAARRDYLRKIPSGPVGQLSLPEAMVRARNRYYPLPRDAELTFGTQRGVSVPIMSRSVSRTHAKIRPEARGYVLYDLMSEAGTFVGTERIESKVLADGDRIRIGPVEILFKLGAVPKDD
jgi:hypothetical protein